MYPKKSEGIRLLHRFKIFWERWVVFSRRAGTFNARVILTIFYFVISPICMAVKVFSDPLRIKREKPSSNWQSAKNKTSDLNGAGKQY